MRSSAATVPANNGLLALIPSSIRRHFGRRAVPSPVASAERGSTAELLVEIALAPSVPPHESVPSAPPPGGDHSSSSPPPTPVPPPPAHPRSARSKRAGAATASEIRIRLFTHLQDVRPETGGFNNQGILHKLFRDPGEVESLCLALAQPYLPGEDTKKTVRIAAVIGIGGYGSVLAFGMAKLLPPYPFGEDDARPVSSLSIEAIIRDKEEEKAQVASLREAIGALRGRRVVIVVPVLTPETCADIQLAIKLIEDKIGANVTVFGISALYQLQCSDVLPRGRKPIDVRAFLRLDFDVHSSSTRSA